MEPQIIVVVAMSVVLWIAVMVRGLDLVIGEKAPPTEQVSSIEAILMSNFTGCFFAGILVALALFLTNSEAYARVAILYFVAALLSFIVLVVKNRNVRK